VKASAQPGNIVSGTSRHKYFKKPLVPHLHAVAPSVLLAPTAKVDPMVRVVDDEGETVKDVGVQTKYRDSEVQVSVLFFPFCMRIRCHQHQPSQSQPTSE